MCASFVQVRATVLRNPALLAVPLQAWHDFFAAIGLEDSQFWQLCCNSPGLLLRGSVWQTGNVLMFLQALGWSELELSTIIIPHHAEILQVGRRRQQHDGRAAMGAPIAAGSWQPGSMKRNGAVPAVRGLQSQQVCNRLALGARLLQPVLCSSLRPSSDGCILCTSS